MTLPMFLPLYYWDLILRTHHPLPALAVIRWTLVVVSISMRTHHPLPAQAVIRWTLVVMSILMLMMTQMKT